MFPILLKLDGIWAINQAAMIQDATKKPSKKRVRGDGDREGDSDSSFEDFYNADFS
jgi:hypothetical protein